MGLNWSEGLSRLSLGLSKMGEEASKDEDRKQQYAHEDARDAANHAFEENLRRLDQAHQDATLQKTEDFQSGQQEKLFGHEDATQAASQDFTSGQNDLNRDIEKARLGQEAGNANRNYELAAKSEKLREDEAESSKARSAEEASVRRAGVHQKLGSDATYADEQQLKDLQEQRKSPTMMADPAATNSINDQIAQVERRIAASKQQTVKQVNADLDGTPTMTTTGKDTMQSLSPIRQAYARALMAHGATQGSATARAQSISDQELQSRLKPSQPGGNPQGSTDAPPDAAPQPPAPDQDQPPDPHEIAQQLDQTPEGKGTASILDSLQQAQGIQADKLRRAAMIGLRRQYPDMDPNAIIDAYQEQNSGGEPSEDDLLPATA